MPIVKERKGRLQSPWNIRVSREIKARVARADEILDQDLTESVVSTLAERAVEVIYKHDHIVMSSEEKSSFSTYWTNQQWSLRIHETEIRNAWN